MISTEGSAASKTMAKSPTTAARGGADDIPQQGDLALRERGLVKTIAAPLRRP